MKKVVLLSLGFWVFMGTCQAFNEKNPFENFRISIFEQIVSEHLIVRDEKRTMVLMVMRKMKVGEKFLKDIQCEKAATVDRGALDKCLNKVFFDHPEKFKAFYKKDLDVTIKALKKKGFIMFI